jgi:hypothetical protein
VLTSASENVLVDYVQPLTSRQSILDSPKHVVFLVYRINTWVL